MIAFSKPVFALRHQRLQRTLNLTLERLWDYTVGVDGGVGAGSRSRNPSLTLRPEMVVSMRLALLVMTALLAAPALAQEGQVYFRRKSNQQLIGPNTELKPSNCRSTDDGGLTCDVEIVNPADPHNSYRSDER